MGNILSTGQCLSMLPVHPHACGEHIVCIPVCVDTHGSSPRLWGTWWLFCRLILDGRFIPTPVGNILLLKNTVTEDAVHPHACGEHCYSTNSTALDRGSSPRLWGTLRGSTNGWARNRFIPTPVGNIICHQWPVRFCAVHPHACGEHNTRRNKMTITNGSSPRLWGTLL